MSDVQFMPVAGTLPTIAIPETVQFDHDRAFSNAKFAINTDAGEVLVEEWSGKWLCTCNAKSLIAAGIARVDWLIEGRKSWCIVFDESGARLRTGGRGTPKGQYINIDTYCDRGDLRVWLPMPTKQKGELIARYNAWREELGISEPEDYRIDNENLSSNESFLLASFRAATPDGRAALLRIATVAFDYGKKGVALNYHTEGNIIYLGQRNESRATS